MKPEHETRRKIIREWMSLPKDNRRDRRGFPTDFPVVGWASRGLMPRQRRGFIDVAQ